jgi:dihydroneopterin aldolase
MVDKSGILELEGMEFHAFHGVLESEKVAGNLFVVDFRGVLDMRAAAQSDAFEDALNYAEIYDVSLVFVDKDKDMTLKHYARVKIMLGEEVVCDELLADVFENDDIVLDVDLTEKKSTELKIVYYLPIEIGNEAKNAEAVFELQLTASNE